MHISESNPTIRIKTVMFDLGNVLLFFSHDRMFRQIAQVLSCDATTVEGHLKNKGKLHQLETGLLLEEDFLRDLIDVCGRSSDAPKGLMDKLKHAMSNIFTPNKPMIDLLPSLKNNGKKLILVSNTSSIHFEYVQSISPWLKEFDALVLSYEIKAMKPDPDYYLAALKVAQESPDSCLLIDDIAENVAGAEKAGFQTHQYRDHNEFLRFLTQTS